MTDERETRRQTITVRAIFLGLISVVFMQFLVNYQAHVKSANVLNLAQLPAASLIIFMLWVIINSVLRLFGRRFSLSATEVLTISRWRGCRGCWRAGRGRGA